MKKKRIVIIGAGRCASGFMPSLASKALVTQVCSRNIEHARKLATPYGAKASTLANIDRHADYYIIAVSDDAITTVIDAIPDNGALWMHTSGTCPMEVFAGRRKHYGTWYPLSSFNGEPVNMDDVPIFVNGKDDADRAAIEALARAISHDVRHLAPEQMPKLHLAAVFANNFSNHMLTLANNVLDGTGVDVRVMLPMLELMLARVRRGDNPHDIQTGPARRGDLLTIERHLAMTADKKMLHDIYKQLSQSIMDDSQVQ